MLIRMPSYGIVQEVLVLNTLWTNSCSPGELGKCQFLHGTVGENSPRMPAGEIDSTIPCRAASAARAGGFH